MFAHSSRRHGLGQWFTPPDAADLTLALALPGGARGASVVDPTCGDGVFLARATEAGVARAVGIDIDADVVARARANAPGSRVLHADLFGAEVTELFGAGIGAGNGAGIGRDVGARSGAGAGAERDGWVDAVVGNPPYVRQERLSAGQKQAIRRCLQRDWPEASEHEIAALCGRGDLAAPCVARALALVRPGGRVAFVVSSALLDADYASALWSLVARRANVLALVEAPGETWFADASINPMVLVIERRLPGCSAGRRGQVVAARLDVPTARAARQIRRVSDLDTLARVRRVDRQQPDTWAAALRASDTWFQVRAAAGRALVPLGELAEVKRGITSGANDVFYLSEAQVEQWGIEAGALVPLVKAPRKRGAATIEINPAERDVRALWLTPDADLSRVPAARAYIEHHRAAAERPTLRNRRPWWALPGRPARLFLTKAYFERFVQQLASAPVLADQRVYTVQPRPGVDVEALAAVLNASVTSLALESLGRASMGEGALEWTVADARTLPVADVRGMSQPLRAQLGAALSACARQPVGPVADEVGKPHRRALDQVVHRLLPGELPAPAEVADALVSAVARRVDRARRG